jgi:hypothetical protein
VKGLETAFTILLNPKKKTNMSENSDKLYWVYDKKTGKIKGFDKWKDAVKYDKLLNQNKDE